MNIVKTFIKVLVFFCFFFSRKVSSLVLIFPGLTCDFFQVQCISIVKRKVNSTIDQQKYKGHQNVIVF